MVTIVQKGHPVLRQIAKAVETADIGGAKLKKILADMSKALAKENDGVAIAAPQIGISLRIFMISGKVFQKSTDREQNLKPPANKVFINPKIIKLSRQKVIRDEGCLSVRPWYGKTKRAEKATVEACDETGKKFTSSGGRLLAQIYQHETDHLNGILFDDHATELKNLPADPVAVIAPEKK